MLSLPSGIPNPASEARIAFERLLAKLDSLESDFDRLAERAGMHFPRTFESDHTKYELHSFIHIANLSVKETT
jgi:hypothetical protein